jgi:hypothetical protein
MAEGFVELGAEGVNYVAENHWDKIHDPIYQYSSKTKQYFRKKSSQQPQPAQDRSPSPAQQQQQQPQAPASNAPASAVSGRSRRKQKNRLPSPEGSIESWNRDLYRQTSREDPRSPSLDRESQRSEQVIRAYEADPRDPPARPEQVLPKKDLRKLRRDSRMSYANGYGGGGASNLAPGGGYDNRRASSQQPPPRPKYYDDDDSDYDERTGERYRTTGRGYDDRGYGDDYDREVITTERYKGVSGALVVSLPISSLSIPSHTNNT